MVVSSFSSFFFESVELNLKAHRNALKACYKNGPSVRATKGHLAVQTFFHFAAKSLTISAMSLTMAVKSLTMVAKSLTMAAINGPHNNTSHSPATYFVNPSSRAHR